MRRNFNLFYEVVIMKKYILFTVNISFFCFVGILGFTYLNRTSGYSELLSHFAFSFFLISIIYSAFYMFYRNKLFIVFAFISCVVTAYPWISLLAPADRSKHTSVGDEVSILQLNIWYAINDVEGIINYIKEKEFPDIVLIQEATPDLVDRLGSLKVSYPYTFEAPENGAYGMILFSKIPISKAQRNKFDRGNNHYTLVDFRTLKNNIPFTLIELHACSPAGDSQMNRRRQELEEISKITSQLPNKHKILIGDLNTTPYSPYFTKLLKDSGLVNSMQGLRIQGTWPSYIPFFLRIPLDNLLVSDKIHVVKQEICPPVGSDHLPVLTYIRMSQ